MEFDLPEKTTQDFEGPGMISKLDHILATSIKSSDPADYIEFPREREDRKSEGGNSSSSNSKNGARDGRDGADYYGSGSGEEKKSGEKENRKSRTKSKSNSRGQELNDFETGQDEQQPMPEKRSSKPKRPDSASRRRESDRKEYNYRK